MVIERALKYVEGESDLSLGGVGGGGTNRKNRCCQPQGLPFW